MKKIRALAWRLPMLVIPIIMIGMSRPAAASEDMGHGEINSFYSLDRFEYRRLDGNGSLHWDAHAWIGGDYRRLWLKTEGDRPDGADAGQAEFQLVYGYLISPYWELQAGLRHDARPEPSQNHAVLGLQGLAPFWVEVDAALFLSERGVVSARLKAEQDWLITQRLILQPRLETTFAARADADTGVSHGIGKVDIELRLRYEIVREFAPYLGVVWQHGSHGAGDSDKEDSGALSLVAGIRAWF